MKYLNKNIFIYLIKFFAIFCIIYFGTVAVEGLSAPGNYYSQFIHDHLDYPSWLRVSLLNGSKYILKLAGYATVIPDNTHIQMLNGRSVQLIYACLGVGVMSFWMAFVLANRGGWARKTSWIIWGLVSIWLINIARISLFLIAVNKQKKMPFGLDNHSFFAIIAYIAVFVLIYFYDRSSIKAAKVEANN